MIVRATRWLTLYRLDNVITHYWSISAVLEALDVLGRYVGQDVSSEQQQFNTWKTAVIVCRLRDMQELQQHEVKCVLSAVRDIRNHDSVLQKESVDPIHAPLHLLTIM